MHAGFLAFPCVHYIVERPGPEFDKAPKNIFYFLSPVDTLSEKPMRQHSYDLHWTE